MDGLKQRIAHMVRTRRNELKLSQEQLAEMIDKTPSFIGQVERGECSVKLETLQSLISCLGIDANDIFSEDAVTKDEISELFDLSLQMDETNRHLLIEFARLLHKLSR